MTFDQRPPSVPLRRRIALATKGLRTGIANGVAGLLGLKMVAVEPERPPVDRTPKPAPVPPRPAPTAPAAPPPKPAAAPAAPSPAAPSAAAGSAPAPAQAAKFAPDPYVIRAEECTVCGDPLVELSSNDYCPNCNAPARIRILPALLEDVVAPAVREAGVIELPALGFAMAGVEKQLMGLHFPLLKSVSLFGNYGGDHEMGVDARDLTRFADQSFSVHASVLLFDYFTEQDQGIREAYRVLAPGGVFFTQLGPYRLLDGDEAPYQIKEVRGRPGYFEYLPEGVALADIRVGRQWFLQAMQDAGFQVRWIRGHDRAAGVDLDWFVGFKPR